MIFRIPGLDQADQDVLDLIAHQRDRLAIHTMTAPRRWAGTLRRSSFARAIQGSNSIEGYHATMDEAVAAVEGEPPIDQHTETWSAILGYRNALTFIGQAAHDPSFEFGGQFLKSLHFMMVGYDMGKYPGQWRPGPVFVVRDPGGDVVYEAPDPDAIIGLIAELVAALSPDPDVSPIIRAAMAHLNLAMIHPFKDGNGRMARALQTFVLAREGLLHPVFSSIEEWLGRNTAEYYDVLARIGQGAWNPHHDAHPWIRFCLKAHYQQAATLIRRHDEYERLFERVSAIATEAGMPDRSLLPTFDAALGLSLTNQRYRTEAGVTEATASRDLRRLTDAGLLDPVGEKRGRRYAAGEALARARRETRIRRPLEDPYAIVARQPDIGQPPRLPGL